MLPSLIPVFLLTALWLSGGHFPQALADSFSCDHHYRDKNVRFVVPYSPGGGYDAYARVFAPHFEMVTGARVRVVNVLGNKGLAGFRTIRDATPDGFTMGIVNGTKRGIQNRLGDRDVPDLLEDFSILARIARNRTVVLTGGNSDIEHIEQLYDREPAPVYGANNLRTGAFLSTLLVADLLEFDFDVVSGLGGTRKRILAASRGDVDITASNFHSVVSDIESGSVRPILQLTASPITDHASLVNVPHLGGADGVAAKRAGVSGRSHREAIEYAQQIEAMIGLGRLVVAPDNLDRELYSCMELKVLETLQLEAFRTDIAKVNLVLDIANGETARKHLEYGLSGLEFLVTVIHRRLEQL